MSEIDTYHHICLGIVTCPSRYPVVPGNDRHRDIPLYRLDEDALDAVSWQAKQGDVLLGGGAGESAALRIALPETLQWFTEAMDVAVTDRNDLYVAYWSMNDAYIFGDGYSRVGWQPPTVIETWLVEQILAFLVRSYPTEYQAFCGSEPLEYDGSICRLPTEEEQQRW